METVTWFQRPPGQRPPGPKGQLWDAPPTWQTALRAPLLGMAEPARRLPSTRRSTGLNGKKWIVPTSSRRGPVVFISTGSDARLVADFDATETVALFKRRLAGIAGIAADQQILVHAAKELKLERTLGDYCITAGSVIHLTVRLRGGMRDTGRCVPPRSFMLRNLTDTTGRQLCIWECTVPLSSSVTSSGPSVLQLHRRTYELLANGEECSNFNSDVPPGYRIYGGKHECQHKYNIICDALCRVCFSPCTRAISCACVPCAGHLCGDCMMTPCDICHHAGIPKVSRMTRHCTLCYRVKGFWAR